MLITIDKYRYQGKEFDCTERVTKLVRQVADIETVVVIPLDEKAKMPDVSHAMLWKELLIS